MDTYTDFSFPFECDTTGVDINDINAIVTIENASTGDSFEYPVIAKPLSLINIIQVNPESIYLDDYVNIEPLFGEAMAMAKRATELMDVKGNDELRNEALMFIGRWMENTAAQYRKVFTRADERRKAYAKANAANEIISIMRDTNFALDQRIRDFIAE